MNLGERISEFHDYRVCRQLPRPIRLSEFFPDSCSHVAVLATANPRYFQPGLVQKTLGGFLPYPVVETRPFSGLPYDRITDYLFRNQDCNAFSAFLGSGIRTVPGPPGLFSSRLPRQGTCLFTIAPNGETNPWLMILRFQTYCPSLCQRISDRRRNSRNFASPQVVQINHLLFSNGIAVRSIPFRVNRRTILLGVRSRTGTKKGCYSSALWGFFTGLPWPGMIQSAICKIFSRLASRLAWLQASGSSPGWISANAHRWVRT